MGTACRLKPVGIWGPPKERSPRASQAISNVAETLKRGSGVVLFRDYAEGDLAHQRLQKAGRQQKLGPGFYVRGDGTRCYYFAEVREIHRVATTCPQHLCCVWARQQGCCDTEKARETMAGPSQIYARACALSWHPRCRGVNASI
jgi:hypothetical protein